MALRAIGYLTAAVVAGLAFSSAPAVAGSTVLCSYDKYGRAYNCHSYVVAYTQSSCGSCGNRGLFTTYWTSPCGYNPCQQTVVVPTYQLTYQTVPVVREAVVEDDDDIDEPVVRRHRHHHHYQTWTHPRYETRTHRRHNHVRTTKTWARYDK